MVIFYPLFLYGVKQTLSKVVGQFDMKNIYSHLIYRLFISIEKKLDTCGIIHAKEISYNIKKGKVRSMRKATVFDVAKYILKKSGEMTAMKLQKLVFYVKAWGLVWDEEEIFSESFEAWANGAVSPSLYDKHRGMFKVSVDLFSDANCGVLKKHHKETIDRVIDFYGKYTAQQLSDINHQEAPWKNARGKLSPTAPSKKIITPAAMEEYYSGIWNGK